MKCKLRIGTKVRIARIVRKQKGYKNTWAPNMDIYVNNGNIYTVIGIGANGVRLGEDEGFGWPSKALRTFSRGKPLNTER